MAASGTISKMTPFTAPTKWSLVPKSVVSVTIGRCANWIPSLEDRIIPVSPTLIAGEGARQGTVVIL